MSQRSVPPFLRCLILELRKEEILTAQFEYLAPRYSRRGADQGSQVWTTVQFYTDQGDIWIFGNGHVDPTVRTARQELILNSLDWLLENGAPPNQCSASGLVPLHIAAGMGRVEDFDRWVSLGADPEMDCVAVDNPSVNGTPGEILGLHAR